MLAKVKNLYKIIKSDILFQCMPHYPRTQGSRKVEMSEKNTTKIKCTLFLQNIGRCSKAISWWKVIWFKYIIWWTRKVIGLCVSVVLFHFVYSRKRMVLNEVMLSWGCFPGTSRIGELPQWQVTHYLALCGIPWAFPHYVNYIPITLYNNGAWTQTLYLTRTHWLWLCNVIGDMEHFVRTKSGQSCLYLFNLM